jgi:hypothetical protein
MALPNAPAAPVAHGASSASGASAGDQPVTPIAGAAPSALVEVPPCPLQGVVTDLKSSQGSEFQRLSFTAAQQDIQINQLQVHKEDVQVWQSILTSTVAAQAEEIRALHVQLATLKATSQFLMEGYQSHNAQTTEQEHTVNNIAKQAAMHEDIIYHLQD